MSGNSKNKRKAAKHEYLAFKNKEKKLRTRNEKLLGKKLIYLTLIITFVGAGAIIALISL